MIARAGDVVVLESPPTLRPEAADQLVKLVESVHKATGVLLVFAPAGTKSPEPEGLKALVDEVAKLRSAVEHAARGSQYGGPR